MAEAEPLLELTRLREAVQGRSMLRSRLPYATLLFVGVMNWYKSSGTTSSSSSHFVLIVAQHS
jgi:hypothetical protein